MFWEQVIGSTIYDSCCVMSDVALCTAPPIGGPSCKSIAEIGESYLMALTSSFTVFWSAAPLLQGTVDGRRHRGRPHQLWKDNIEEWTGQSMSSLLNVAEDSHLLVAPTTPGRHRF